MNIKKYLKNLWNKLVNDESGQYAFGGLPWQFQTQLQRIAGKVTPTTYYPTQTAPRRAGRTTAVPKQVTTGTTAVPKTTATQPVTPATSQLPALTAALGYSSGGGLDYSYQPFNMPAYTQPQIAATPAAMPEPYNLPQYNVNLPTIDWSFAPTEAQRGGWLSQAQATAAQEIDPQLQAIAAALQQYLTQGQVQRAELNPRYTNQSLAIANIIQNTVKQEAINSAIRRGAESSGWLPSALMQAGQLETEQRGQVEAQRNLDLNALAALEAQQTQAAGEQSTMLEGLRGQRTTTALADLYNQAMAQDLATKQSQWGSALGGEQLRASSYGDYAQNMLGAYQTQTGAAQSEAERALQAAVANAQNQLGIYQTQASIGMSNADRALQAAIAEANQRNTQWEQQFTTSQSAYERALEQARIAQSNVQKTPLGYVQGIPYYDTSDLQRIYATFGLGSYAEPKTTQTYTEKLQEEIMKREYEKLMDPWKNLKVTTGYSIK